MDLNWDTVASVATAGGVLLAAWQIRAGQKLAQSTFEDTLDQQYRGLAKEIPVDALIGKEVRPDQLHETRELVFNYLDLCNEQVFLRKKGRISKDTWNDWCAGIGHHLDKVEFRRVWEEVKESSPGSFGFLEKLERDRFDSDPKSWR